MAKPFQPLVDRVDVAGTAAGAAMAKIKEDKKRDLNARLRGACTSDPLARSR